MLTFFSFILSFFGSLNWFFIAAFQYDIVAGFFGTQASLFSRIIYFVIGMAGFVLLFMALKNKGYIKITENAFKKDRKNRVEKEEQERPSQNAAYQEAKPLYIADDGDEEPQSLGGYKDFDPRKYD